jgi:hypothetical protein
VVTLLDAISAARAGRTVSIRCPAHDDRNPSLSVRPAGASGWIRLKCFKGCGLEEVLGSVGLDRRYLAPPRNKAGWHLDSVRSRPFPIHGPTGSKVDDDGGRRLKRSAWPAFQLPTARDLDLISEHRKISTDGLALAVKRGLLWILPDYKGHRAWIVSDASRNAAQARRLDGAPWRTLDGTAIKAWSLPGTCSNWPVGLSAIGPEHEGILLLEGGPDLLAAHGFLTAEKREASGAAVCMLGSAVSLPPECLHSLRGRKIRIVAHADQPGQQAANRWGRQLLPLAACVDVVTLGTLERRDGSPCKDLNDASLLDEETIKGTRILHALTP